MISEMHRPLATDKVGEDALEQWIAASPAECDAVAARLDIPAVLSLDCRFRLTRAGSEIVAEGDLHARLVRLCVVSLDSFETDTRQQFRVRFVPEGMQCNETDLDLDRDDEIPYGGGRIDLGEAAVEELALSLDPYPRRPDLPGGEFEADEAASPFAVLARRPQ